MRRQASSAKLTNRSYSSNACGMSPYEKNYKGCLRIEQRELIFEHQRVAKLTRRDLEDQYINLCDEHYALKREHRCSQEKIKRLLTKILRISSLSLADVRAGLNANLVNRPRDLLSFEEKLQICIFDLEYQNTKLHERLHGRHGISTPTSPPHPPRPVSEVYSNCLHSEQHRSQLLPRHRARSCHQINGSISKEKEKETDTDTPQERTFPEPLPVKLVDENVQKVKDLEEKNEQLAKLLSDFNEQLEKERNQNKDISYKLKELEIRKHISENIELINLKEKLEQSKAEFKKRLEHLEASKDRNDQVLIEEKLKLVAVTQRLQDEEERTKKLSSQLKQVDGYKKQIEDLREQLIESESEKQSLKTQQERFALLLKESVHQGDRIQTLKDKNALLQSQLDEARANEMAVVHAKTDLVEKIINIQDENDRISIELEGLRSLLAQDNEYSTKEGDGSKRIEKKFNLQDVGIVEMRDKAKTKPKTERAQSSPVKRNEKITIKQPFSKTVGVNTETIVNDLKKRFTKNNRVDSQSSSSTVVDNNLTGYDEPLTMDSDRSSLVNFAETIKERESPRRSLKKRQPNHLELLERAALYGPFSLTGKSTRDTTENNCNSISESLSLATPRYQPAKEQEIFPNIQITLKSFQFNPPSKSASIYHLEVTVASGQSFITPRGFDHLESTINCEKTIKLTSDVLKSLANPDESIRFLLLEKPVENAPTSQTPLSSVSSSTPDETTSSSNLDQCRETAYGSLKYATVKTAMLEQCKLDQQWSGNYEVPFHATQYSHPDIGRLSLHLVIDGVAQVRQLLTNAKP